MSKKRAEFGLKLDGTPKLKTGRKPKSADEVGVKVVGVNVSQPILEAIEKFQADRDLSQSLAGRELFVVALTKLGYLEKPKAPAKGKAKGK